MDSSAKIFKKNIQSVEKLINFDREVLSLAIGSINNLHEKLINKPHNFTNDQLNGKRTLEILKGIRSNDSLKGRFSIIKNQAIVLLVSYFGSAVSDVFRNAAKIAVEIRQDKKVLNSELKIKVEELIDFNNSIGELLIVKNNISFQDMNSIRREFKNYFGIIIKQDELVNNIILGQACRHSIVHEGGIVNSRVINQVKSAKPRQLKETLCKGDLIEYKEDEIKTLSNSMLTYIKNLEIHVENYKNKI